MEVVVYDSKGSELERLDLDESVFGVPMNEVIVHQALVRQRANGRVGTAKAKTRAEVAGSSHKLYRQKHTGRARAGNRASPLRRHGGTIFGPKPRNYRQALPKKMRRKAIRCLLSAKVSEGYLKVVNKLEMEQPRTSEMNRLLKVLKIEHSALIALPNPEQNTIKSVNNLPGVKTIQARQLNVVDLLSYKNLIITSEAIKQVENLWGSRQATEVAG
ncbi:MAG: 50S ribosomal protein L4 [Dehalococcoidia bacterium]